MDTLRVPATMEHFEEMISFVSGCAETAGFEKDGINQVALASEEILVNVISYAYPESEGDLEIEVEELEDGGGISITVRDSGVAFNPLDLATPDIAAPAEDRPIGGLGIFMVQQIMDAVRYERQGVDNVVTMLKRPT